MIQQFQQQQVQQQQQQQVLREQQQFQQQLFQQHSQSHMAETSQRDVEFDEYFSRIKREIEEDKKRFYAK